MGRLQPGIATLGCGHTTGSWCGPPPLAGASQPLDTADMVDGLGPTFRLATTADSAAIDALMKASIRDLFPASYDERQTASSMIHVGHVDRLLIDDGTYFVIEASGDLVASGGW